jgi:hypothetical protein
MLQSKSHARNERAGAAEHLGQLVVVILQPYAAAPMKGIGGRRRYLSSAITRIKYKTLVRGRQRRGRRTIKKGFLFRIFRPSNANPWSDKIHERELAAQKADLQRLTEQVLLATKLDAMQTSAPTAPRSTGHSAAAYGSCGSTEEAISAGAGPISVGGAPVQSNSWPLIVARCNQRRTDGRGSSRSNAWIFHDISSAVARRGMNGTRAAHFFWASSSMAGPADFLVGDRAGIDESEITEVCENAVSRRERPRTKGEKLADMHGYQH